MFGTSACPDSSLLERFLLGEVAGSEADQLEEHLTTCSRCTTALASLRAEDTLVTALRCVDEPDTQPQQELVEALLPLLKRLRSTGEPTTLPPASAEATETPVLERPGSAFTFLRPAETPDELGRLGPYRVLRPLGAGGMGVVFLAEDPRLKRHIALKVIRPELAARRDLRQRFLHEAQAVAAIEHDNIVAVYHVDEDQGVPFLAMPLLRGETLEERLQRAEGPLPLDETLRIARETAAGLAAAHDRGLIHRDIKPGNLWLETPSSPLAPRGRGVGGEGFSSPLSPRGRGVGGEGGRVKILDFGLARALQGEDAAVSQPGALIGTPAYMAPEQGCGRAVDVRADLFSLGCVLYRMATGRLAFQGADALSTLVSIATEQPPPPQSLNPRVPPALAHLIVQLLAKQPAERPPSAQAVVDALGAIEEERAGRARRRRRRRLLVLTAILVPGASALTAWLVWWAVTPPPALPPSPAAVTFAFDEPDVPLALRWGESEQHLDLAAGRTRSLAPGTYAVHPAVDTGGRRLVPDHFTVQPGEQRTLTLRLVGEVRRHEEHSQTVWSVALAVRKEGMRVLAASNDHSVSVWDPMTSARPRFLEHGSPARCVAASGDGRLAASGGGGKQRGGLAIRLWDLETLTPKEELRGHQSLVTALAFAPDGKHLLSGSADGMVLLWDLEERKARSLAGHDGLGVNGVAFAPEGRQALTCGGDGQVLLWEVLSGKLLHGLQGHSDKAVRGVAWGPEGSAVAWVGLDGTLHIWDLKTRQGRLFRGSEGFQAVAWAGDGKRLLTGDAAGGVRLWDAATLRELYHFEGHRGAVYSVAFTPDGQRAVSGGADASVRLWTLPGEE